jgi:hypothetical protein
MGMAIQLASTAIDFPVGGITAWLKSYTNTPALPAGWKECDGTQIVEARSVFNGQTIPNLNNGYFIKGASTSGTITNTQKYPNASTSAQGGSPDGVLLSNSGNTIEPLNYTVVFIMRIY